MNKEIIGLRIATLENKLKKSIFKVDQKNVVKMIKMLLDLAELKEAEAKPAEESEPYYS